jgi:hypothetical protein
MPRKTKQSDIEKNVMAQIEKGEVKMKPKTYFILGSLLMAIGVTAAIIVAVIFLSINIFSLRIHGPLYGSHLTHMLRFFPWWAFIIALFGIISGYYTLKKYDFSYKNNYKLITLFVLLCIIIAAYLIDYFSLNNLLLRQPPFRGFYKDQFERVCLDNPKCRLNPRINRDFPDRRFPPPPGISKPNPAQEPNLP